MHHILKLGCAVATVITDSFQHPEFRTAIGAHKLHNTHIKSIFISDLRAGKFLINIHYSKTIDINLFFLEIMPHTSQIVSDC